MGQLKKVRRDGGFHVEMLEGRRLLSASAVGVYSFGGSQVAAVQDGDGTVARFSLPGGKGVVDVEEDGWHVLVSKGGAGVLGVTTSGGNKRVTVVEVTLGKPLGGIDGPGMDLAGAVSLVNTKSVVLGNVVGVSTMVVKGKVPMDLTVGKGTDLSVTATGPLGKVTAKGWGDGDGVADVVHAPSIGTLAVKGNMGAQLVLGSKKVALGSATIGGTIRGAWAIAGSVGTLRLHSVRANLAIGGSVGAMNLDDFVTVSQAGSATGGVIHIGGKGKLSAGKGQEKFDVAKKTTLYTSTANMYRYDDLYAITPLGWKWTYSEDGKKQIQRNASTTQTINGHVVYSQSTSGADAGEETNYIDASGADHLLSLTDPSGNSPNLNLDLKVSPGVYRLGTMYHSSSKASGSFNDSEVSIQFHGTVQYTTRLVGFEVVKVKAGTFLAAKLVSTLVSSFSGTGSGDGVSTAVGVKYDLGATEWAVPGVGVVKTISSGKATVSVPAANDTESQTATFHSELVSGPVMGG